MISLSPDHPRSDLAEIQGLYGSFSFPERLLQKIWLRREFNYAGARTVSDVPIRIVQVGKWNLLGGPDFRQARLQFADGPEIDGDVELHLRAADWDAHAHARDPAYANVILHVVLFWPEPGYVTRGSNGREIPVLALLPLLHHDLEEYAADEAVESLSNRPTARLTNELAVFPAADLRLLLRRYAEVRWRQKVHYAWVRVQKLGWENACHHGALEVLGYRYNRAPMLRIATRWSLRAWAEGRVAVEEALLSEIDSWSVQGVRPANHPRARLRQYADWTAHRPDWPDRLVAWWQSRPEVEASADTRSARRQFAFSRARDEASEQIIGQTVGGSRLENVICDAFLPLLAARLENDAAYGWWFHWFCGDLPPFVNTGLRQLGVWDASSQPACHGLAQGLLGWLIERELRR